MKSDYDDIIELKKVTKSKHFQTFVGKYLEWLMATLFVTCSFSLIFSFATLFLPLKFDYQAILLLLIISIWIALILSLIFVHNKSEGMLNILKPGIMKSILLGFIVSLGMTFIETDARVKSIDVDNLKLISSTAVNEMEKLKNQVNLNSQLTEEEKKIERSKIEKISSLIISGRSLADKNKNLTKAENEIDVLTKSLGKILSDEYLNKKSSLELKKELITKMKNIISRMRERIDFKIYSSKK